MLLLVTTKIIKPPEFGNTKAGHVESRNIRFTKHSENAISNSENASSIMLIYTFFNFNNKIVKKSSMANKSLNELGKPRIRHFSSVGETGIVRNSPYSRAAAEYFYHAAKGK